MCLQLILSTDAMFTENNECILTIMQLLCQQVNSMIKYVHVMLCTTNRHDVFAYTSLHHTFQNTCN